MGAGYLDRKAWEVRARRAEEAPAGELLAALRDRAAGRDGLPSFASALRGAGRVALIAEFKRRSPSAGTLVAGEAPADVARLYEREGAAAVSVLTDAEDFGGDLVDLEVVGAAVKLPALRKDFLVDVAGLYEARAAGASAGLLIAAILTRDELKNMLRAADEVDLECLVEVHDESELSTALEVGATLIGINNRNLRTLTTDLGVTERLAPAVPEGVTLVSESGIQGSDDVRRVRDAGVHAVLVGESLLRLPPAERGDKVAELSGVVR
ncbi:MAG: indole-3-glycerol-phosphate synthase TrpC [Gemmatimonadetes bacterium]|nr:indole-3-glycerol-phosphate synthase TrpC [Gemmatimonadota bacterium]NIO31476.1 indole-3-glycerol-phosphate synthase TrpC [Gemmatimonadota bacterium]